MPVTLVLLLVIALLTIGMLLGCSLSDARYEARSRQQAATQRVINAERQALREATSYREPGGMSEIVRVGRQYEIHK
jgi:hypothetical protein